MLLGLSAPPAGGGGDYKGVHASWALPLTTKCGRGQNNEGGVAKDQRLPPCLDPTLMVVKGCPQGPSESLMTDGPVPTPIIPLPLSRRQGPQGGGGRVGWTHQRTYSYGNSAEGALRRIARQWALFFLGGGGGWPSGAGPHNDLFWARGST